VRTSKTQTFVREPGRTADARLRSPGFPVEICGVDALHAPFFTERRTRGPVQCCVAGNPGRDDKGEAALTLAAVTEDGQSGSELVVASAFMRGKERFSAGNA
jgi:hypothetical protein